MKTAIIIFVIFAALFWLLFKFFQASVISDPLESARILLGKTSAPAFLAGVCRVLFWLCGIVSAILLLIYFL